MSTQGRGTPCWDVSRIATTKKGKNACENEIWPEISFYFSTWNDLNHSFKANWYDFISCFISHFCSGSDLALFPRFNCKSENCPLFKQPRRCPLILCQTPHRIVSHYSSSCLSAPKTSRGANNHSKYCRHRTDRASFHHPTINTVDGTGRGGAGRSRYSACSVDPRALRCAVYGSADRPPPPWYVRVKMREYEWKLWLWISQWTRDEWLNENNQNILGGLSSGTTARFIGASHLMFS